MLRLITKCLKSIRFLATQLKVGAVILYLLKKVLLVYCITSDIFASFVIIHSIIIMLAPLIDKLPFLPIRMLYKPRLM